MKFYLSLILSAVIVCISACTKIATTDIGSGLIPPVDGVNTKDTSLDVLAVNAGVEDTIRMYINEEHVAGFISDPLFGETRAKIDVQLQPDSYPYSFPVTATADSLHLDSVVLILAYKGAWGDTTSALKMPSLKVFEISKTQPFAYDTVGSPIYPVTAVLQTGMELTNGAHSLNLSNIHFPAHRFDEDSIDQIRIPLNPALGETFLRTFDSANEYKSDSAFRSNFRGFQIAPELTGNSLVRIDLTSSKLAIYFNYQRRDSADKRDTTVRYFQTNQLSAHLNEITRTRSTGQVAQWLNLPPGRTNDSLLFLQTSPGTYATIKIPGINTLPNVLIHRAELIVEQEPDASNQFFSPPNLFLAGYSVDSLRRFALFPDVQFGSSSGISNLSQFGVIPFKEAPKTFYTYHFNISRFVQGIVTEQKTNSKLILFAPYNQTVNPVENTTLLSPISSSPLNPIAVGRVRVGGGGTANPRKMRLHIIYSLVK